jgi:uncharacterized protein HemX
MDAWLRALQALADLASIITAVIAVGAAGWYFHQRRQKRLRLENYLKAETGGNETRRTVTHLAAELGMTEAEVMDAAIRSRDIDRSASPPLMGAPSTLLFRYSKKRT